ncbi:MAG TPA: hypothetical protein VNB50_06440 [Gaiellaceae bacterium]|nr:hypothetical protein [Gaiellaceae bacterium]
MNLDRDLRRIADAAVAYATAGEDVAGIVPTEPGNGLRLYVCAYGNEDSTTWLVLDATGVPVEERSLVHDAVSIAALCEVAEEAAGVEPDEARVASPALLDELGGNAGPELGAAVQGAGDTIEELMRDVERGYKRPLS